MAARLGGKGKIVELKGPVDSLWDQEVASRLADRTARPRLSIRLQQSGRSAEDRRAGKLMKEALGRVETIDAVFAYDDAAAKAAYEVAKAADRAKGVLFVGSRRPAR